MKKIFLSFSVFVFSFSCVFAQNITTASAFFSRLSERYANINNYVANITIKTGNTTQSGVIKFKKPNFLRIDFYYPKDQYILFANDVLNIYLPSLDIVLSQKADPANSAPSLATGQGLSLMKRSYIIAYETSASPKPIQEGGGEEVIVLSMERRSGSEPFRKLRVMISPETNLIRRIECFPVIGEKVVFDFSSYRINPGIPGSVFVFEPEHTSTILNDFLYME
ncbi:MAG: LolA family protein [Treponema sp.]